MLEMFGYGGGRYTDVYVCTLFDGHHCTINLVYDIINFFPERIRRLLSGRLIQYEGIGNQLEQELVYRGYRNKKGGEPRHLRKYHCKQVSVRYQQGYIRVDQHCLRYEVLRIRNVILLQDED